MATPTSGILLDQPDRNLALELVRATEAAAIRAVPFIGRGDKNGADGAAVDAMRGFLGTVSFRGTIVIGEGEKDHAPMLYNGEVVGNGTGPECDIAVDPIDGTSLTAAGRQNAISMIAAADRGAMLDASTVFYMDKLVTGSEGIGVVDIRRPIGENIRALAAAKGKPIGEMVVGVLDRPRHEQLIDDIRAAGAGTRLHARRRRRRRDQRRQLRGPNRHLRRNRRQPGGGRDGVCHQGARRVHPDPARAGQRRGAPARHRRRAALRPRLRGRRPRPRRQHLLRRDRRHRRHARERRATQGADHPHREHRAAREVRHHPPDRRRPPRGRSGSTS